MQTATSKPQTTRRPQSSTPFFGSIQPKLTIGAPNDQYEHEADQVADHVMKMEANSSTDTPGVQRKGATCESGEMVQSTPTIQRMEREKDMMQTKPLMQKSANGGGMATQALSSSLHASKGGGAPLPVDTNHFMSQAIGNDFTNVRIHTGSEAVQMNRGLNARAFTHGSDMYFNQGEYAPSSHEGKKLLAHELTHVVQQKTASPNTIQRASLTSDGEFFLFVQNDNPTFYFTQLATAVRNRYRLDSIATSQLARWIASKNNLFQHGNRMYLPSDRRISMPRTVAFFLVDWVEPFNPFAQQATSGGDYRILPAAFQKAQDMWAQENVFVGFRRGAGINAPTSRRIQFNPGNLANGDTAHTVSQERNLLAQRPAGALPNGFFHIVVTGSTNEGRGTTGKTIRSRREEQVQRASEGILLFAQTYHDEGYRQTAPQGNTDLELGELLAHEIGHFLFRLRHYEAPRFSREPSTARPTPGSQVRLPEAVITPVEGFMGERQSFDPNDRLGATSRREMNEAFERNDLPQPENATE